MIFSFLARPAFAVAPRNKVVGVGRRLSVKCVVTGNPPPAVYWSKVSSQVSTCSVRTPVRVRLLVSLLRERKECSNFAYTFCIKLTLHESKRSKVKVTTSRVIVCLITLSGKYVYGVVGFNVLLDPLLVISGTVFPACSHLPGMQKPSFNQLQPTITAPGTFIWGSPVGLWDEVPRSSSSLQISFTDVDWKKTIKLWNFCTNSPPDSWPVCFTVGLSDVLGAIDCLERLLRNHLLCVEWDFKPYTLDAHSFHTVVEYQRIKLNYSQRIPCKLMCISPVVVAW